MRPGNGEHIRVRTQFAGDGGGARGVGGGAVAETMIDNRSHHRAALGAQAMQQEGGIPAAGIAKHDRAG
jgi:hypothetical protein